jgi:hypothetical protein
VCTLCELSSKEYTISGSLRDKDSGEDLLYATVFIKNTTIGTTTNEYGFYSLTLEEGEYTIVYSYMGYTNVEKSITLKANAKQNVEMSSTSQKIEEVVVTAERQDKNVTRNETGIVKVDMKDAKLIPVFLGEQDVLKTMQLMPGVSSSSESSSGFHVRGGSIDQNLILLDESPVYNASHLLGFFSVFNSDAIKDMKMYKGGTPARYGGRSSSVMDIRMKDGNMREYTATGGIGLLSSRLSLEGPIVEDEGSFMISGRRTYLDLFFPLMGEQFNDTELFFYDLNLKANYRLSDNDRIYLTGYFGRDVVGFGDFGFDWGNVNSSLRWNHLFSNKFFSNLTFITSDYSYNIDANSNLFKMNLASGITSYDLKQDFSYNLSNNTTFRFGYSTSYKTFQPGEFSSEDVELELFKTKEIQASDVLDNALYFSHEQKYSDNLTVNLGLRYSFFNVLGGRDFYTYDSEGEVVDKKYYSSGDVVKTFHGFEPRLNLTYLLSSVNSIKASYNRMYQYVHLMSNSNSGSPMDYWVPTSTNVDPQSTDQYSLGYYHNFLDNKYELSIETYYKDMANSIEYRDGSTIMLNEHIEGDILSGDARAYGVEFMFKKTYGEFTGWLGYTWSKTEKQFDEINSRDWFPATYDRTHDISLVGMYKLNDKWKFSASWVYQTGKAVTFPAGVYDIDNQKVKRYTLRNSYRMPDYHRLDLGAIYTIKDTKDFKSELVFSVYNAYGRDNAYSISFQENAITGQNEAIQISLFKFLPSITWNFKF